MHLTVLSGMASIIGFDLLIQEGRGSKSFEIFDTMASFWQTLPRNDLISHYPNPCHPARVPVRIALTNPGRQDLPDSQVQPDGGCHGGSWPQDVEGRSQGPPPGRAGARREASQDVALLVLRQDPAPGAEAHHRPARRLHLRRV